MSTCLSNGHLLALVYLFTSVYTRVDSRERKRKTSQQVTPLNKWLTSQNRPKLEYIMHIYILGILTTFRRLEREFKCTCLIFRERYLMISRQLQHNIKTFSAFWKTDIHMRNLFQLCINPQSAFFSTLKEKSPPFGELHRIDDKE